MDGAPVYPHRTPVFRLIGLVLSLGALVWFLSLWRNHVTTVERYDAWAFVRTSLPEMPLAREGGDFESRACTLVMRGPLPAVPSDTEGLTLRTLKLNRDKTRVWLAANVYGGSIWWALKWPLAGFGFVLIALLIVGGKCDRLMNREARDGKVLRGPKLMGRTAWNRRIKRNNRGPCIRVRWGGKIHLPKDRLNGHIVIRGATRTGKSTLVRQLVYELLKDGPIVFLDVKREFIEEFSGPDDWILDPGDKRCPRWATEREALDEMRATAAATAAFPDEPRDVPFFKKHPRFIAARILATERPTTQQFAELLTDHKLIDKTLRGTLLAHSISPGGGEMRAAMLAHLAELGRSLSFWPTEQETDRAFSVREWSQKRKGNIFLTSEPDTIEALRPSQSMLLDMLILGMQKHPGPGALVLDEIAQMDRLPKLETAMSLQGAAGNPIILCIQEITQLKAHYGDMCQAISSQAYTQIVFRTAEYESAEHASGLLSKHEIERVRESRPVSVLRRVTQGSFTTERPVVSVVLPGEIQALENLCFYIAQAGNALKGRLTWLPPVIRAPRLIERLVEPAPALEPSPTKLCRYSKKSCAQTHLDLTTQ